MYIIIIISFIYIFLKKKYINTFIINLNILTKKKTTITFYEKYYISCIPLFKYLITYIIFLCFLYFVKL